MRSQIVNNKYSYVNNQATSDTLEVFIDGDIVDASTQEFYKNWWGDDTTTSYKSFRDTVLNSAATRVNININSGGGQVADALAMHDFIKEQISNGRNIHTYGKGIVASAATYPLLAAGNNCHISENCFFMIHNVSGGVYGSIDECEAGVRMMRKFNNCARDLYASYFDKPKETIAAWMNAETWWTGADMKDSGFIKNCLPPVNAITKSFSKDSWPFQNMAILNTINKSIKQPQNKGMKKNTIINAINKAFEKYFSGDVTPANAKPADLQAAITNAINAEEDDDIDPAAISTAVSNAMGGDAFNTAVANAVAKALEKVPQNITEAITNATSALAKTTDVVTKDELETLKNDLSDKLGGQKPKNTKGKPGNEHEDITDTEGITWNISRD